MIENIEALSVAKHLPSSDDKRNRNNITNHNMNNITFETNLKAAEFHTNPKCVDINLLSMQDKAYNLPVPI